MDQYPQHFQGDPRWPPFRGISLGRLDHFEGGPYANSNLSSMLFLDRTDSTDVISMQVWDPPNRSKPTFKEAVRARGYKTLRKGDSFGPIWSNHWVKLTIKTPSSWKNYDRVQLEFDPSCEAMIFDSEGTPLQGITGGYGGDRRVEYILTPDARGFSHTLYIEVTCNGMFGLDAFEGDAGYESRTFSLNSADLVAPRQEAWHLLWDFRTIKDLAKTMPDNSPLQHHALQVAYNITNLFRHDDLSTIDLCRMEAEKILGKGWQDKGAAIYDHDGDNYPQVWGIGNCHIDTAWLWPFSATQQKTARSWATQIDLMERYPEYRFCASQAQQFKWLEQQYPSLFDKIKAKVASGQFQTIGGCWVEMDTNLPSGEALCRQMIYGQRYFKSRFGKFSETLWLPDTFGYSAQLPQIARLAGMKNFLTQKLSWSQFNRFPHTSFSWVGIDGSQVLTHMPPVDTYTAQATVGDVSKSVTNHKSLDVTDISLLPYGNGDGGGGPLAPMLESLRRIRAAAETCRDIPKPVIGRSVDDFFAQLLSNSEDGKQFATWIGELYFEYHRGTYTSHGSIKNHNRRSELLMRDIEMAATLASLTSGSGPDAYRYPKEDIDKLWEDLLLCQFHDVLPGSAIEMVYRDAEEIYHNLAVKGHSLLQKALSVLHSNSTTDFTLLQSLSTYYATNLTGRPRVELVQVSGASGRPELVQSIDKSKLHLVLMADMDGSGCAIPQVAKESGRPQISVNVDGSHVLANDRIAITVSAKGRITSILDIHQNRELVAKGSSGGFVIFEDTPNNYDAWDADIGHLDKRTDLYGQVKTGMQGLLRASLLLQVQHKKTTIETTISLDNSGATIGNNSLGLIRFSNHVHWHAEHEFLKFELPTTLRSDAAIYDVQFGVLSRPTHRNTSWDAAKFEVCCHKFADLSEYGYGLAIINDNKYGFAVANNIMRLSLLRSARYPDRHQDQGTHSFEFAVYPHACHFMQSDVPEIARNFNAPFHVRRLIANAKTQSLAALNPITLDGPSNMVLETIKRGDDDDFITHRQQSIVLRIFDAYGGAGAGRLNVAFPIKQAAIVDLLEREIENIDITKADVGKRTSFTVQIKPFQVLTVKLLL